MASLVMAMYNLGISSASYLSDLLRISAARLVLPML